jgi:YHS domain-containing protein/peroxiredoxin
MAAGPALAQCGGCPSAAGCGASQMVSLKLVAVNGDTFDVGRMVGKHPLVLLVAGTDNASKAAAAAFQKAFEEPGQKAKYFGVINAGMKAAETAARGWKLGYSVLSDPDKQAMAWLNIDTVPSVTFVNAAGQVTKTETKVTEANVVEGVMALAQSAEKLVDPVCGMTVTKESAAGSATYQGKTYYFCSTACKDNFTKDPQKYLAQ